MSPRASEVAAEASIGLIPALVIVGIVLGVWAICRGVSELREERRWERERRVAKDRLWQAFEALCPDFEEVETDWDDLGRRAGLKSDIWRYYDEGAGR